MKIPTFHLRLLHDPRSDAFPPVIQQWWVEILTKEIFFQKMAQLPQAPFGEWRDVSQIIEG